MHRIAAFRPTPESSCRASWCIKITGSRMTNGFTRKRNDFSRGLSTRNLQILETAFGLIISVHAKGRTKRTDAHVSGLACASDGRFEDANCLDGYFRHNRLNNYCWFDPFESLGGRPPCPPGGRPPWPSGPPGPPGPRFCISFSCCFCSVVRIVFNLASTSFCRSASCCL